MPIKNIYLLILSLIILYLLLRYLFKKEKYQIPSEPLCSHGVILYNNKRQVLRIEDEQIVVLKEMEFTPYYIRISKDYSILLVKKNGKNRTFHYLLSNFYYLRNFCNLDRIIITPMDNIKNQYIMHFAFGKIESELEFIKLRKLISKVLKLNLLIDIKGYSSPQEETCFDKKVLSENRAKFVEKNLLELNLPPKYINNVSGEGLWNNLEFEDSQIVVIKIYEK
ncbi:hypothetical protein CPAV1605_63 [seawater metagenome]|uniref:OmpA-like domain-containing protein n=1 Tax=seawater metagenome TaxID=1561972 RepID=A0A5E8CGN9_9ZZZZ